jgi:hypothetical protein
MPEHPRAVRGYVREHILVASEAMGRPLRPGEVVHHINENMQDNRRENLLVFKNNGYHLAHHQWGTTRGIIPFP